MSVLRRGASMFSLALLASLVALPALADDLSDFEHARASYDAQRYAEAVRNFELLVGSEPPRLTTRSIVLEARKYLGASYLFVARRADAERQFALLLAEDPQYQIDPTSFPTDVREVFAAVRTRLAREAQARAEARAREDAARRATEAARVERERERQTRLMELAVTETVTEENERWIAAIPFGIGQFQNGDDGLGLALAVTEGVLAATAITMKILYDALPPVSTPVEELQPEVLVLESAYRITNYVAMGLLAGIIVIGIVDAEVRFVPSVTRTRRRAIPDELRDPAPAPSASLGVGPTSATFQLRF